VEVGGLLSATSGASTSEHAVTQEPVPSLAAGGRAPVWIPDSELGGRHVLQYAEC